MEYNSSDARKGAEGWVTRGISGFYFFLSFQGMMMMMVLLNCVEEGEMVRQRFDRRYWILAFIIIIIIFVSR